MREKELNVREKFNLHANNALFASVEPPAESVNEVLI